MRGFGFNQRQTSGWSHIDSVLGQCALGAERHVAVNQSKQGVVLAHADVVAGVEACTALTHDDGTSADQFTAEDVARSEERRLGKECITRWSPKQ